MRAQGRLELERHLAGKRLFLKAAVLAKCYECTGRYEDGKTDCLIPSCPLHPWMPYRTREDGGTPRQSHGGGPERADGEHDGTETTQAMAEAVSRPEAAYKGGRT